MASKRERFRTAAAPNAYFLDADDVEGIRQYLGEREWLMSGEAVLRAEIAGQGNMNCVVRAVTPSRSFILKQSRPWVEKYSDIAAPFDRAIVEAEFYRAVSGTDVADWMPQFYWVDPISRILCLEDIGTGGDSSSLYAGVRLDAADQQRVCGFLSVLHHSGSQLLNREMRALNHSHIFVFPFDSENGLDLEKFTPGLKEVSQHVKNNSRLLDRVKELGQVYLSDGTWLLHGDYFPGSWMRTTSGIKIIDPEFAFTGPREFDVGVMMAHLTMSGDTNALDALPNYYAHWSELDQRLVEGFAGVEVLRRLLGVAQLPLKLDLDRKRDLIESSIRRILE